jgi:hypothetical protein
MEESENSNSDSIISPPKTESSSISSYFKIFYHPRFTFFVNTLNSLFSIVGFFLYIYTNYRPNEILRHEKLVFIFNFFMRTYFFLLFLMNLKAESLYNPFKNFSYLAVEIISTVPYLFARITVGMKENLISNTHNITSSFIVFRIFKLSEFSRYIKSDVNRELFSIIINLLCIFISAAVILNVIENTKTVGNYYLFLPRECDNNCSGDNNYFHTTVFYVFSTIGIIGYYSNVVSLIGRIIVTILIIIAFIEVPSLASNLMNQLSSKSIYARTSYKKLEGVEFILISGNISGGSIKILLQEYFHPDHGENERHALILMPQRPDTLMKSLLQKYQNKLFYFEGDPLKLNDLQRCQFKSASMIMLLCNKQTDDSSAEDSKTIIQAMAIKKYFEEKNENDNNNSNNRLSSSNSVKPFKNSVVIGSDKIVTEEINLAGKTHTLKSNTSNDNSNSSNLNNNPGRKTATQTNNLNQLLTKETSVENQSNQLIIQLLRPESEHHFALSISKNNTTDQIICIEELKLSLLAKSCLCRGIIALLSNLIITNNFEEGIEKQIGNFSWIEEYKHGKDYEIYKIPLDYLRGYKYSTIVEKIYKEKKTILFGLNIECKSDKSNLVLLSPMDFILPFKRDVNVFGYLLAKDQNDADNITAWTKTQKRAEIKTMDEYNIGVNKNNRLNGNRLANIDDEELDTTEIKEKDDTYSTDALSLAKICHITTEHIAKTSVTIYSIDKMLIANGHIIICGLCQNLIDFIKPLRSKSLPKNYLPSIVILNKDLPDDKLWNTIAFFEQIYLVQGDCMNIIDLRRAGILSAKRVVILTPSIHEINQFIVGKEINNLRNSNNNDDEENSLKSQYNEARKLTKQEEDLLDAKSIFTYNLISKIKKEIFIIIELINPNNVSFLNNKNRRNNDEYLFIKAGLNIDATASFASGEIYYSSIMDNLITQAYYNPSLLSVLKKLIVGESLKKKGLLTRYEEVPSGNLFLIDIPIGLFQNQSGYNNRNNRMKFEDIFLTLLKNNVIVIGVYRLGDTNGSNQSKSELKTSNVTYLNNNAKKFKSKNGKNENFYYVVTAPENNFEVNILDKLFVIATDYPESDLLLKNKVKTGAELIPIDNDPVGIIKMHNKKPEEKKEIRREIDEEGEKKLKQINDDLKDIRMLIDDIQTSIEKVQKNSDKIIIDNIKKKITSIYKQK